ncbi:uncharacterized [Tachysurus ichikawai]
MSCTCFPSALDYRGVTAAYHVHVHRIQLFLQNLITQWVWTTGITDCSRSVEAVPLFSSGWRRESDPEVEQHLFHSPTLLEELYKLEKRGARGVTDGRRLYCDRRTVCVRKHRPSFGSGTRLTVDTSSCLWHEGEIRHCRQRPGWAGGQAKPQPRVSTFLCIFF